MVEIFFSVNLVIAAPPIFSDILFWKIGDRIQYIMYLFEILSGNFNKATLDNILNGSAKLFKVTIPVVAPSFISSKSPYSGLQREKISSCNSAEIKVIFLKFIPSFLMFFAFIYLKSPSGPFDGEWCVPSVILIDISSRLASDQEFGIFWKIS